MSPWLNITNVKCVMKPPSITASKGQFSKGRMKKKDKMAVPLSLPLLPVCTYGEHSSSCSLSLFAPEEASPVKSCRAH